MGNSKMKDEATTPAAEKPEEKTEPGKTSEEKPKEAGEKTEKSAEEGKKEESKDEAEATDKISTMTTKHPLQHRWVLWYNTATKKKDKRNLG